ncbi:hypothetical protein SAMN05216298_1762 [Glycomyces sambucus]|uniref:Uncharacterized protein n=1 Tax=Glycomyces sambucus TaxID=380244 RepID=A0A1G9FFJ2_9ACTN|nr:hypothetical protein [Glycomyces sambucus]SDK87215.1 hypothetical protein SAMN05216298_1762 [Glycomyces sambucus]
MKTFKRLSVTGAAVALSAAAAAYAMGAPVTHAEEPVEAQQAVRPMEDLGRGVVAVRNGSSVLVSWRLLGLDPSGTAFNVYRSANGGAWTKLNGSALTGGTNYTDTGANLSQANAYRVAPVLNGTEQAPSTAFTLTADHADEPAVRIPLRSGGPVKFTWTGDLDGDGEFDYVVDRQTSPQSIEAYTSTGRFLWSVNLGPNSTNQDNIEPGSATIDVGHWDGVTVQDFNADGYAEVALKFADGVTFGDGQVWTHADDDRQWVGVLDGRTGALRNYAAVPQDYLADGPLAMQFGVGYLDGTRPYLVASMKNRKSNGDFNMMISAWTWSGQNLTQQWKWLRGSTDAPDGHNIRIADVDGDGTDEVAHIGFVLNGDGTLRYSLAGQGIVHGDRFHIADIDPSNPGLEGYGVQQSNGSGLREYYYDAASGQMIWQHVLSGTADVGRGMAGDVDPRYPGMEVWSFDGLYNAAQNRLTEPNTSLRPWPQLGLWWDGDLLTELLNDGKLEEWDPLNPSTTSSLPRIETVTAYGAAKAAQGGPTLVGDLLGDWREEAVYTNAAYDQLIVFTTDKPTSTRLYTLAHNPLYRNCMTTKGYMQSHHTDYFLGSGMATPPAPPITY